MVYFITFLERIIKYGRFVIDRQAGDERVILPVLNEMIDLARFLL